jgi:hypothetical protein
MHRLRPLTIILSIKAFLFLFYISYLTHYYQITLGLLTHIYSEGVVNIVQSIYTISLNF